MFELTKQEVAEIGEQAEEYVDRNTVCKTYEAVYPAIKPILDAGGKMGDAVDFLIEQGVLVGQDRAAAIRGFNRVRRKWNQ